MYGCVYSVHPLFQDDELQFRSELVGTWQVDDETIWKFKPDGDQYEVIHIDKEDTTYLEGRLGQLGDHYYMDFFIGDDLELSDMEIFHLFPTHTFAKITFGGDEVIMEWFTSQWLEDLIKDKRIRIKHELANDSVLLTASTAELQKFIQKYSDEPKAFDDQQVLKPLATR